MFPLDPGGLVLGRLTAGFVIGAALAALGLWLAPSSSREAPPTTEGAPPAPIAEMVWVAPGEVRFGNSLLLGRALRLDGDRLRFEYDVASLGPTYDLVSDHDVVTAAPAAFRATLATGEVIDTEVGGGASSAAFAVPDGVTAADVTALHLTEWRVRVPIDIVITLPAETGASAALPDGSTIAVDTILEQSRDTIIQFDYEIPPEVWPEPGRNFYATPDFSGAGAGWRLPFASMGLTRGFQLTWDAPTLPDEIAIRVRLAPWHRVVSDLAVPVPEEDAR